MNRLTFVFASTLVLLQACSSVSDKPGGMQAVSDDGEPVPVPELTLNLPDQDCECVPDQPETDRTFLDRGFTTLVEGDHIAAVQHFQRYQRLEKTPLADWEAGVAIAYVSTLSNSPFYDPGEARKSYRSLNKQLRDSWDVDERITMMQMSLESFRVMYRHQQDLEGVNATLKEDLAKREEAIKRLRELTLGQKATRE